MKSSSLSLISLLFLKVSSQIQTDPLALEVPCTSAPASSNGSNCPAEPAQEEAIPGLTLTQNGTAVIIPPNYWQTIAFSAKDPSQEVYDYLDHEIGLGDSNKELIFFHEYVASFNGYLSSLAAKKSNPAETLLFSILHFRPTLNTILGLELWANLPFDVGANNCLCTERDKFPDRAGGTWTWSCSPIQKTWRSPIVPVPQDFIAQAMYNVGFAQWASYMGVTGLLKQKSSVEKMLRIKVSNPFAKQDEVIMGVAGLPANASTTMLGAVKKLQYGLYQQISTNHENCPMEEVACGKYAANTCEDAGKVPTDSLSEMIGKLNGTFAGSFFPYMYAAERAASFQG